MISGVYQIRNKTNNDCYVGSAVSISGRWATHKRELKMNAHGNILLTNAWNKYSADSFVFEIVEKCKRLELIEREQHYLDTLKPVYNICKIAGLGSRLGIKHSEETKKKISNTMSDGRRKKEKHPLFGTVGYMRGKKHSEAAKRKISASKLGKSHSKARREIQSSATKKWWAERKNDSSIRLG